MCAFFLLLTASPSSHEAFLLSGCGSWRTHPSSPWRDLFSFLYLIGSYSLIPASLSLSLCRIYFPCKALPLLLVYIYWRLYWRHRKGGLFPHLWGASAKFMRMPVIETSKSPCVQLHFLTFGKTPMFAAFLPVSSQELVWHLCACYPVTVTGGFMFSSFSSGF